MKKNCLVAGAPDIAHPRNCGAYEWQLAFITAWFTEMLDRIESGDDEAAHSARAELETLWLNTLGVLLRFALDKKASMAKGWAGRLLATIFVSIYKHDSEKGKARRVLSKTNDAYRKQKRLLGKLRTDVLLWGKIAATVQQELRRAKRYRERLLILKARCGKGWYQEASRQRIPEDYLPFVQLPDFSEKSEARWWDLLWPLIEDKIDVSKLNLLPLMQRDLKTGGVKPRRRYRSDCQRTARGILQTFARWNDEGVLY